MLHIANYSEFELYLPIFTILPQISQFRKVVIFQVYLQLLDQLLHPYKFNGRDISGILFFASCEPLKI